MEQTHETTNCNNKMNETRKKIEKEKVKTLIFNNKNFVYGFRNKAL